MINLREFLKQGSLFTVINTLNPFPFLADKAVLMDTLLSVNYGERVIFDGVVDISIDDIAEMVLLKYTDKWESVAAMKENGFDVGAWNSRKLTETITETENRNNTNESINKVSAYNTDVMIDNDGATGTGTETVLNEKVRTLTDSTGDLNNAYNHLSLVEKNNIMNVVLHDVADFLTLSIYS